MIFNHKKCIYIDWPGKRNDDLSDFSTLDLWPFGSCPTGNAELQTRLYTRHIYVSVEKSQWKWKSGIWKPNYKLRLRPSNRKLV